LSSEKELINFMKTQISLEKQIVESLNNSLSNIENPAVKGVLKGISLDSIKHSEIYASAVKLLTGISPALTQEQLDKQKELVERHIRMEENLIKRMEEVIPTIQNEKIRLLLNAILTDERRHHKLLREVLKTLVRGETITEDEWWDVIWKNAPFHGAPGG